MSAATRARSADASDGVLSLVRLLQLASPALPIGAYCYSQGIEWMIDSRAIRDAAAAQQWIGDVLEHVVADGEAAVLWRLLAASERGDTQRFRHWSAWHRASRESRELRAETEQMGVSLVKLATELGILDDASVALAALCPITLPAAFAPCAAARRSQRDCGAARMSWPENQALVAVKALPLGQAVDSGCRSRLPGEFRRRRASIDARR
jgi:urease accessory protein